MHNVRQQNRPPVGPGDLGPKQDHWREVGEGGGAGGDGAERRGIGERRTRYRCVVDCVSVSKLWPVSESRVSAPARRAGRGLSSVPHAGDGNAAVRSESITRDTRRSIRSEASRRYPCPLIARSLARSLATRAIADTHARREPRLTRGATSPSVLYE